MKKPVPFVSAVLLSCFSALPSAQAHPGHAPHVHPFTLEEGVVILAAAGLWVMWRTLRAKRPTK